jgi:hypothetical protein
MRRKLAAGAVALTLPLGLWIVAAGPATAVGADRTEHGTFVEQDEFDDTEYCAAEGVPSFHVVVTSVTDYTVFYDANGEWLRVTAHHVQKNTLAANGKTLYEQDRWTNVFYPDGTATTVGSHTHIRGETGMVLRDSGRIVESLDGTVVFQAGKWPQLSGTTFCQELLP